MHPFDVESAGHLTPILRGVGSAAVRRGAEGAAPVLPGPRGPSQGNGLLLLLFLRFFL